MLKTVQVNHFGSKHFSSIESSFEIDQSSAREQFKVILNLAGSYRESRLSITIKQQSRASGCRAARCANSPSDEDENRIGHKTQPKTVRDRDLARRLAGEVDGRAHRPNEQRLRQVGTTLREISDRFAAQRAIQSNQDETISESLSVRGANQRSRWTEFVVRFLNLWILTNSGQLPQRGRQETHLSQ